MLLIIFISQKFCVVKSVHVNLSYIVPQIYINMHEIWINVGMLKKYYNICVWYIIYNQYSIITDIFRSLYLFYPFCPLNPYLTSKTRVGRVFAIKPGFLPSLPPAEVRSPTSSSRLTTGGSTSPATPRTSWWGATPTLLCSTRRESWGFTEVLKAMRKCCLEALLVLCLCV